LKLVQDQAVLTIRDWSRI